MHQRWDSSGEWQRLACWEGWGVLQWTLGDSLRWHVWCRRCDSCVPSARFPRRRYVRVRHICIMFSRVFQGWLCSNLLMTHDYSLYISEFLCTCTCIYIIKILSLAESGHGLAWIFVYKFPCPWFHFPHYTCRSCCTWKCLLWRGNWSHLPWRHTVSPRQPYLPTGVLWECRCSYNWSTQLRPFRRCVRYLSWYARLISLLCILNRNTCIFFVSMLIRSEASGNM